jgi:transcriptional regulator
LGNEPHTADLLRGTLDILILQALAAGDGHGYAIVRAIDKATGGAVTIEDGSLYPALYRLEAKRLVRGEWGTTDAGRRARFYSLTPAGRRQLADRAAEWRRFSDGVARMLAGGGE